MCKRDFLARLSLVGLVLLLSPAVIRGEDDMSAQARGKEMVASAKWQVPAIEGMAVLRGEGPGPLIVLGQNSITALSKEDGKQLWQVTEDVNRPRVIGSNENVLAVVKSNAGPRDGPEFRKMGVTGISLADGKQVYELPVPTGNSREHARGNLLAVVSGEATIMRGPITGRAASRPMPKVTVYDVSTGKEVWHRESNSVESLGGFVSDSQYLTIFSKVFTMLDAATGKTLWERPIVSGWTGSGQVYRPDGMALLLEHQGQDSDLQYLSTMDLKTGKTLSNIQVRSEGYLSKAVGDVLVLQRQRKSSIVFLGDTSRKVDLSEDDKKERVTAFDLKAGKVLWTRTIPQDQGTIDDLVIAGDVILRGSPVPSTYEKPQVWTLATMDLSKGETLWTRENMAGRPVAYKDLVILPRVDCLEGVDRRTGEVRWSIPTAGTPCVPMVVDGMMYAGVVGNGNAAGGQRGIFATGLDK